MNSLHLKTRGVVLVFWLVLIVYMILTTPRNYYNLKTLRPNEILKNIQQTENNTKIDIVLSPSSIIRNDTNYTLLSILRFAPWVNRIHIPFSEQMKTTSIVSDIFSKNKVIVFKTELLNYTIMSPRLTEKFIIIQPDYIFTNYVFSWHFFINKTPVMRTKNMGCMAMTRSIFNQCIFKENIPKSHQYVFAMLKGIEDDDIKFVNNKDKFYLNNDLNIVSSTKNVVGRNEEEIKKLLMHTTKHKTKGIIIAISSQDNDDDIINDIPESDQGYLIIWIKLSNFKNSHKRLSFLHRCFATNNILIELNPKQFEFNIETISTEIMKKFNNDEKKQITKILSCNNVPIFLSNIYSGFIQNLSNQIGNKLSQVYEVPFEVFQKRTQQTPESLRLKYV